MSLLNATKLKKLAMARKDDESNLSITKKREFITFFEQTISSFGESYLTTDLVLYPLQNHLSSPHFVGPLEEENLRTANKIKMYIYGREIQTFSQALALQKVHAISTY